MIAALNPVAPAGVEIEAPPPAAPPLGASAALVAMVEEWRSLLDQLNNDGTTDEAVVSLGDRHNALQHAIYDFPAASVADLLAKVPVFRHEMQDAVSGLADGFEPAETLAGAAWLGLFRDFERLAMAPFPAHSDAALLVDQILACWREWSAIGDGDEEEGSEHVLTVGARRVALIDAADALPPMLDNLTAKALALAWVGYVDLWEEGLPRDGYATNGRLALDIDTAICGRAWTGVGMALAGRTSHLPRFDPAPMSIAALAALYDAARGAAEHLDALGGGPGDPERIGVRAVLGGEADRLRGAMLACADALAEREPRTPAERRARARVRAMHAVEVGAWADLAGLAIAEGSADAEGGR